MDDVESHSRPRHYIDCINIAQQPNQQKKPPHYPLIAKTTLENRKDWDTGGSRLGPRHEFPILLSKYFLSVLYALSKVPTDP